MGAEREGAGRDAAQARDAVAPKRPKRNTDPGVGPPSEPRLQTGGEAAVALVTKTDRPPHLQEQLVNGTAGSHADVVEVVDDDVDEGGGPPTTEIVATADADVVDFDALHAALGDLPPPPTSSTPMGIGPAAVAPATVGESQGRSSATYSSARPHTIPPTRAPAPEVLNAPAVIVADVSTDTVPSAAPQMTVPMGAAGVVVNSLYGPPPGPMRPPMQSSPVHDPYLTPQPFTAQASGPPIPENPNVTVHMPNRPRPRPRTPTIVVRTRGPSKQQKLIVFMAMLLVFVGGGIAALIYFRSGLSIPGTSKSAPTPTMTMTIAPPATTTTATTNSPFVPTTVTPSGLPSVPPVPSVSTSSAGSGRRFPLRPPPRQ